MFGNDFLIQNECHLGRDSYAHFPSVFGFPGIDFKMNAFGNVPDSSLSVQSVEEPISTG